MPVDMDTKVRRFPFDNILDRGTGSDPSVTDYIFGTAGFYELRPKNTRMQKQPLGTDTQGLFVQVRCVKHSHGQEEILRSCLLPSMRISRLRNRNQFAPKLNKLRGNSHGIVSISGEENLVV